MVAFIVLLQCNKYIVLKEEWIESPILSTKSKVFHSANQQSVADFLIETKFYFHDDETCCYMAYICMRYNNEEEAMEYLANRKPRVSRWLDPKQMYLKHPEVIEKIEISSDSSDDDASNPNETEDSSAEKMKPGNRLRVVLDRNEVLSYQKTHQESDQMETPNVSFECLPQSIQVSNESFLDVCQDSPSTPENRKKHQACSGTTSRTFMTRSKFQKFLVDNEANRKKARARAIKFSVHGRNSLASSLASGSDDVEPRVQEIVVKLEKENEDLYAANLRLNQRVGLEEIIDSSSESSDDNEFETAVNTRNYQIDGELAKSYYFITSARGDRYYLNETLKLKLKVVETLKKMNTNYPKMNADYDVEYLYHAMRSIYKQKVLEDFSKSGSLRSLGSSHLKFLRVLFQERANNDKKRVETFREKAIGAAKRIHNTSN